MAIRAGVTLFSWGYEGWGNWTDKLVEAVDAVEKARGYGPPLFVDIRASRKVRAEGFREHAFERKFGADRYRWMNGLGNKAILTGEQYGSFVNPTATGDLLDLALEMAARKRRLIFFCSCRSPTGGCHRHWVAPELFKVAKKRGQPVTTVEWPGYETEPGGAPSVEVEGRTWKALTSGSRTSVPLGDDLPEYVWLAMPWFTPVHLVEPDTGDRLGVMFSSPAQYRAGGWQLLALGNALPVGADIKYQSASRKSLFLLPRSWPSAEPSQSPQDWRKLTRDQE